MIKIVNYIYVDMMRVIEMDGFYFSKFFLDNARVFNIDLCGVAKKLRHNSMAS